MTDQQTRIHYAGQSHTVTAENAARLEDAIATVFRDGLTVAFVGVETTEGFVRLMVTPSTPIAFVGVAGENPTKTVGFGFDRF